MVEDRNWIPLLVFSSAGWTNPALSASVHAVCPPASWPSWWPSLDCLQFVNVPFALGWPKPNTVLRTCPHKCQIQGNNHFPQPAGHALANTDQYVVSPHCCRRNWRCLFGWLLTSTFLQSYFLSCVSPACTWDYDIPAAGFCIYFYWTLRFLLAIQKELPKLEEWPIPPSRRLTAFSSSVSSMSFVNVQTIPLHRWLVKKKSSSFLLVFPGLSGIMINGLVLSLIIFSGRSSIA